MPPRRRLIPACAGQTGVENAGQFVAGAHPRVCGADGGGGDVLRLVRGSSPRVRGRPAVTVTSVLSVGLIPACAGQTGKPHAQLTNTQGSSPRVRGRPFRLCRTAVAGRLIPACAGQTRGRCRGARPCGAHPRVCGADLGFAVDDEALRGLIPACAGQTCYGCGPTAVGTAHPRVCGADLPRILPALGGWGSSPRVRGRRLPFLRACAGAGLIPACAGQTDALTVLSMGKWAHPRVCGADSLC